MFVRRETLLVATATLLSSDVAFAAEGEISPWTLLAHLLNLAVLLWIIIHFARDPVRRALRDRAETVSHDIDQAKRLHAEAEEMLATYSAKMEGLEREMQEIVEEQRREGEAEKKRLIDEASAEAERIRREAERTAETEIARAKARLEAEVVDRAIEAATKAVREKMTPADQRRLTADYLSQLEESSPA